jgi:glycosyltransferase involved in cell wall biosynthesis
VKIGYVCADPDIALFGHDGCSLHVRQVIDALADLGHDVFVLCNWLGDPSRASVRARVHHVVPTDVDRVAWETLEDEPAVIDAQMERDLRALFFNEWLQSYGADVLREERPDFLYERYGVFAWGGGRLARRFGVPHVIEVNGPSVDEQMGYLKFPLHRTAKAVETAVVRAADACVAVSDWLRDWLVSLGARPETVHVVPNGVAERFFVERSAGDAVRARHGLCGLRVVGFAGNFHPWQDVAGLLDAFAALHREDASLRLLLVGTGPELEGVRSKAASLGVAGAVVFAGRVPHEEMPQHLAAMDVAVAPYAAGQHDFYFSPLKLFEYMAAGLPTVAADRGQMASLVHPGVDGWLYPAGDASALRERLRLALHDAAGAERVGRAARTAVREAHTWRHGARRIAAIGEGAVEARRRPSAASP